MPEITYCPAGPLLAGTRSTAVLGLEEREDGQGAPVVLIWAPEDLARDADKVAELRRETFRAVALEHPHIVRVHGLTRLDRRLARVVEFVDGESLRQVLDLVSPLPPRIGARIAADVALGLHYAHLAGNDDGTPLVHGDVRPETVMISFAGKPKIAGYGALSVAPREPTGMRVLNRRKYCAPEQIIGGRSATTPQTDVFLLGLLLYECVTGRRPFGSEENFDHAVVEKELALGEGPGVPAELAPILERATAKRAADRYPSALAFRDAVDEAYGPLATHAEIAEFMEGTFPAAESPRTARREVLEAARAAQARRSAERRTRAALVPRPPPPAPVAVTLELERPPPPAWRNAMPLVLGGSVALIAAAAFWGVARHAEPKPMVFAPPTAAAPVRVASAPPRAALAPPAPSVPEPARVATPLPAVVPVRVVQPALARGVPNARLDLTVDPPVDVTLDGKPLGRPPLTVPVSPGRHVLGLVDRAKGVNLTRPLIIGREGITTQELTIKMGNLSVQAPTGAKVFVDGKDRGAPPLSALPLYEGNHQLRVTLGDAVWQQTFVIKPDQTLRYDVDLKPSGAAAANGG